MKSLVFLISMILVVSTIYALPKNAKLKRLEQKIHVLQADVVKAKKKEQTITKELKNTEVAIGRLATALRKTGIKLEKEKKVLKKLKDKQDFYIYMGDEEKRHIHNVVREFYMLQRSQVLSRDKIRQKNLLSIYYNYLLKAKFSTIRNVNNTLKSLEGNDRKIRRQKKILENLYSTQESKKAALEKAKEKRGQVLKELYRDLKNKNVELKGLINDKKALEKLLLRLEAKKKTAPIRGDLLSSLKGKLLLPTEGALKSASSVDGASKLNGVLIAADLGQEVHAIASGRVIFADWLQGYGLLLIVDHSYGYMSLYGRNYSVYKKTGDNVAKGEVISTVGQSGGYEKPMLYFAMRYNGKPIDPTIWCSKK